MPESTGTTKHESLFHCSVVRGFASDGVFQERARRAWTWRGGPSRAGISMSCCRQMSCHVSYPGPVQSPHAYCATPQTSPYVNPRRGGFSPMGLSCEVGFKEVQCTGEGPSLKIPPNPPFSKEGRGDFSLPDLSPICSLFESALCLLLQSQSPP